MGVSEGDVNMGAYLDCNAGIPARDEVVAAMAETLAEGGNPSAIHAPGRRARARMEQARAQVAALVDAQPDMVIFTSGGTESNNLALSVPGHRLIVSAVEHPSVYEPAQSQAAQWLAVDGQGRADPVHLDRLLAENPGPALVSVMLANNETGVINPIRDLAAIAHAHGALFHCDAAQGPGRLSVSVSDLDVDFLTLSAHKMGGPTGIGALIARKGETHLAPILLGGGQERRRRAGTENLAGIVGFGVAARLTGQEMAGGEAVARIKELRNRLEAMVMERVPAAQVAGKDAERLCNTSCLVLPGLPALTQVMALDLAQVAVSAGSACSSGKVAESRVLRAMGWGADQARAAIRISLGPKTRCDEIDMFLSAWCDLARRKGYEVKDAAQAA